MIRRVVMYVAGGLILVVVAVLLIGSLLPEAHEARRTAHLSAAPALVFATLTDVAHYPDWRDDVSAVEVLSTTPLRWRERSGGDAITFEVIESRPPGQLQVRVADPDLPFGGTWTHELSAEDGGTRLTITERGEVFNPIFRFVSRFVIGHTATIDQFLADLDRKTSPRSPQKSRN